MHEEVWEGGGVRKENSLLVVSFLLKLASTDSIFQLASPTYWEGRVEMGGGVPKKQVHQLHLHLN